MQSLFTRARLRARRTGTVGLLLTGLLVGSGLTALPAQAEPAPTVALSGPSSLAAGASGRVSAKVTTTDQGFNTRNWDDTAGWVQSGDQDHVIVKIPDGATGQQTTVTLVVTDEFGGRAEDSLTITGGQASGTTAMTIEGPAAVTADPGAVVPLRVTSNRSGVQVFWSTPNSSCHLSVGQDQTGATLGCPADLSGNVPVLLTVHDPPTGDTAEWQTTVTFRQPPPPPAEPTPAPPAPTTLGGRYVYGQPGTFSGELTDSPNTVPDQRVVLQAKYNGQTAWSNVKAATTNGFGMVLFPLQPTRAGNWRLAFAGNAEFAPSTGPAVYVRPVTRLSIFVRTGAPNRITGKLVNTLGVGQVGQVVTLQSRARGVTAWSKVTAVRTSGTGTVAFSTRPGSYRQYRLVFTQTANLRASLSGTVAVSR